MNKQEIEIERAENIKYLESILQVWRSPERLMKKGIVFIISLCAISVYFVSSMLLGGAWGYIVTLVVVGAGVWFASTLGITIVNNVWPDGKLAYQACVTMEILIEINKGTYREYGAHILTTGTGKHYDLYRRFIRSYPQYKCHALKRMARINIDEKDMRT